MNLEQQVKHLDKHYRDGNALVTDKEFDILEKQLLAINPDSDYFTNKNALPLPSLEKESIEDFFDGLDKNTDICIEPKLDGCAVAIEYRNGKIYNAITRKGKDIKQKMITIRTVPLTIPTKKTIQVRGELFTDFGYGQIKPGDGAKSQRIASGYLRNKSFDPDLKLTFFAFQIINSKLNQWDALFLLKDIGFKTFVRSLVPAYSIKEGHMRWFSLNYPTDGIVLKINDYKLRQTRPDYWQMAVKRYT